VYEEDPARAAKLLAQPRDPKNAYFGEERIWLRVSPSDYRRAGVDKSGAAYSPPAFRALDQLGESPMVFLHERIGDTGHHRLVVVKPNWNEISPAGPDRRTAVRLFANSHPIRQKYDLFRPVTRLRIPLRADQIMRIYAGQADLNDDAHFTIKYEIDNVPGTIDGRLEADDTVTLRVVDGPAATNPVAKE
jgi:hypothetical protein